MFYRVKIALRENVFPLKYIIYYLLQFARKRIVSHNKYLGNERVFTLAGVNLYVGENFMKKLPV